MVSKVLFKSSNDNWKTPNDVYEKLNEEFNFDFDPCPLYGEEKDGLNIEWGDCNFVNPPYSQISKWCQKAYEKSVKGKTVILLIPSRTDTKYWHDYVMKATEIRFIKGRLKFGDAKNSAPFPSCVVVFNNQEINNHEL